MKITLISDNHGYDGNDLVSYLRDTDEIWHAGDIGTIDSLNLINGYCPIKGVHGNIDDKTVRNKYPKELIWDCEGMKVLMTHIGGFPQKYPKYIIERLSIIKPDLFVCGHSHICRVMYDKVYNLMYMNPGAYGFFGFHHIRTALQFQIHSQVLSDLKIIELGYRGG